MIVLFLTPFDFFISSFLVRFSLCGAYRQKHTNRYFPILNYLFPKKKLFFFFFHKLPRRPKKNSRRKNHPSFLIWMYTSSRTHKRLSSYQSNTLSLSLTLTASLSLCDVSFYLFHKILVWGYTRRWTPALLLIPSSHRSSNFWYNPAFGYGEDTPMDPLVRDWWHRYDRTGPPWRVGVPPWLP